MNRDERKLKVYSNAQCIGHRKPYDGHHLEPKAMIEFKDGEHKDLMFICTMVTEDPDSGHECYLFSCNDITMGPSNEEQVWKVEPRIAAQVFEWFLNKHFDLSVTRMGAEYYFKPLGQQIPNLRHN